MTHRIVDLSIAIENDIASDPEATRPKVTYLTHDMTAPQVAGKYGILPEELTGGEAYAAELVELNTHNGTHVDAPYHFGSKMDDGTPTLSIDKTPLEWYYGPGVKLDFRHFPDGYCVTAADVEEELQRIGHEIQPGDIVVVNTSAGKRYGDPDYIKAGCGMGREATLYLTSRGVRVTGTDCWGWDAWWEFIAERFDETHDTAIIWEGHKAGLEIAYSHIEKMHNLEVLPPLGFKIACFPTKIKAASAGWTRAVAIFED